MIDLSTLATFQDNGTFRSDSRLAATIGGTVDAPLLTSLDNVSITITGASSVLTIGQFTSVTGAVITIDGTDRSFTNLTDIDGSSLTATDGGTLSLPALISYTYTAISPVLQASGSDSVLDLGALTTLTVSGTFGTGVTVEAARPAARPT